MRGVALPLAVVVSALWGAASGADTKPETIEHTVVSGETLWSIAARSDIYADPFLWPVIYKFNRDQIQDPSRIYPHQLLQIPIELDEETRRAARAEAGAP